MRLGLVCPYDITAAGGVQHQVLQMAERLPAYGFDVEVVAPGGSRGVGRVRVLRGNASTVPLTLSPRVRREVRERLAEVDVVHVHEPLIPLVGWAATGVDKPMVATFHAAPPSWARLGYRVLGPMIRRRFSRAKVTAVSSTAAMSVPISEIEIVPNGLGVSFFASDVERVPGRIAFLGRDDKRKGLDVALEAFRVLRAGHPTSELVVMGADRDREEPGIRYLGRVDEEEKRRWLGSAEVFVAPNLGGESFGIVLVEAMAAGCAVVASDLPAFRSVAGTAGRFFEVGEPEGLVREVSGLLDSGAEMKRASQASRVAATQYDWTRVLERYVAIYREITG